MSKLLDYTSATSATGLATRTAFCHTASNTLAFVLFGFFNVTTLDGSLLLYGLSTIESHQAHERVRTFIPPPVKLSTPESWWSLTLSQSFQAVKTRNQRLSLGIVFSVIFQDSGFPTLCYFRRENEQFKISSCSGRLATEATKGMMVNHPPPGLSFCPLNREEKSCMDLLSPHNLNFIFI